MSLFARKHLRQTEFNRLNLVPFQLHLLTHVTFIYSLFPSTCPSSAGSQSTLSNVSAVSHFAASCSLSTSSPDLIAQKRQSIDRWNSR